MVTVIGGCVGVYVWVCLSVSQPTWILVMVVFHIT